MPAGKDGVGKEVTGFRTGLQCEQRVPGGFHPPATDMGSREHETQGMGAHEEAITAAPHSDTLVANEAI